MKVFLFSFLLSFFSFLSVSAQNWIQLGQDIISDIPPVPPITGSAALLDYFGEEVAISDVGDIIAISDHRADNSSSVGITKVFKWNGVSWSQMGQDISSIDNGSSGWSVALSSDGNTIAIAEPSPFGNVSSTQFGLVAVYQFDNLANTWIQLGSNIITNLGGAWFGKSVSLSNDGSILAVGAHLASSGSGVLGTLTQWHGAAQIFKYNGSSWIQQGSDIVGDLINGGKFGWDIELSSDGNRIIIGANQEPGSGYSGPGYVKVFEWNGSSWNQLGNTIFGEYTTGKCGEAVSISDNGNIIAIGEPENDGTFQGFGSVGSVRVFEWDGTVWNQLGNNLNGDFPFHRFGKSLSLSSAGTRLVVGQEGSTTGGSSSGEVKVFDWDGLNWIQLGQTIVGEAEMIVLAEDCAINANGNRFIVGIPGYNFNTNIGYMARVFDYASVTPTFNCLVTGCEDPGDGSGQYGSLAFCESMCSCDSFNNWPTNDPNPTIVPNQDQWCEWCVDYENNGFTNFNPLGVSWGDPNVVCDCCPIQTSFNCTPIGCEDPGDGSGQYGSLADCEAMCSCDSFNNWPTNDQNPTIIPNQDQWCEWCVDYENNGFTNFNPLGVSWGDPNVVCDCCPIQTSFNCTPIGCEDPGDGSGQYGSLADCEAMCSCDLFDSWPTNDPDPTNIPNTDQWCEWCVDYENSGFINFNPLGLSWGDPDIVCDCCNALNVYTLKTNIFKIYPNPSKGKFSVSLDLKNNNDVYLFISNYLGEVVYFDQIKGQINKYSNIIDLGKKAKGIYILNIITNDQNIYQKIIIH